ncbi:MAG: isopeptide-forming domain-containing fimbrial protein [Pyrinomonadaceae bacterium]
MVPNNSKYRTRRNRPAVFRLFVLLMLVSVFSGNIFGRDGEGTPADTVIVNRASASYEDSEGNSYQTVSETVRVTVLAVPAVTVTPDETSPSEIIAPNERITRLFRICNTGNAADSFAPTDARISAPATIEQIFFDADNSGTISSGDTPVVIGQTVSPQLAPGACIGVLYDIQTGSLTPQTEVVIGLTARTSRVLPGTDTRPQDDGTIINTAGTGVILTSPTDANLPPVKLVEDQARYVAVPGQTLNYKIIFRNRGSVAARQVRVVDELPEELEYVRQTLRLNNRSLTDAADADEGTATARRIELLIPSVAPDGVVQIDFQARLNGNAPNGNGVVNFADLTAENAPAVRSTEAVVVVNPVGVVYAGNSGGAVRIAGAKVTVATDEAGAPLPLNPKIGFETNPENLNPFTTNGNGEFSFALDQNQIGAPGSPVRYLMNVTAPNYRARMLEVLVEPESGSSGFYQATIRALDDQAIALPGGFQLTRQTVRLTELAALVFNIPMFELSTLEINKSADKTTAQIGDIITYRVQVKNATASPIDNVVVRDTLPSAFSYVQGTAQIETGGNVEEIEPEVNGNNLTFELGTLAPGTSLTLSYRVRVGANAPEGTQYNSARASGVQPDGTEIKTARVRAAVRIRGGIFSMTQVIIGRVFEDRNRNGKFDKGERPVVGARIYSNNGNSVVTDSAGLYHFPAVDSGSIVLSLDPITLPKGYQLLDDENRRPSKSWTRLLRTPLGGGSMLRQNFAIAPQNESLAVSDESDTVRAGGTFTPPRQTVEKKEEEPKNEQPVQTAELNKPVKFDPATAEASKDQAGKSTETYTVETSETVEPVAPGEIRVISPEADSLILAPALSIIARVAIKWTIETEVNGQKIAQTNIGETRVDNRNQITTYSFVGINLLPGVNTVKLTAVGENNERGKTVSFKVFGRGPAIRLEIVPAKTSVSSDGSEALPIEIRAFDRLGNPAMDSSIAVGTSAGKFYVPGKEAEKGDSDAVEFPQQQAISLESGRAIVYLIGENSADSARVKAVSGSIEATTDIRFTAELRPTLMVGMAELSIGSAAPEFSATGDEGDVRGRIAFYYRGRIFGDNLLTFAYDSQRPLNRLAGRDRLGSIDPLEFTYPIFGDSSQFFEGAMSNSKVYARIDRGRSYAMFGDMEADMNQSVLAGYNRRLTGVKLHLENKNGDFVSLSGARPDTAFSRDVFPGGGLSVVRLAHGDLLPGSEIVTLEVRDRRNPEIILSRENLIRSVDYNLDPLTGEMFFLRPISAFDYGLNLLQVVVTYEYYGTGATNYVYTGRGVKNFQKLGLRLGASYLNQQQGEIGAFQLGGIDLEKNLWNGGRLSFEAAVSQGRFAAGVNVFDFYNGDEGFTPTDASRPHNGTALAVKLDQPLPFWNSRLRADFSRAASGYYNPFGSTVTGGAQRFGLGFEVKPNSHRNLLFAYLNERNKTFNVNNSRTTLSFLWTEMWNDKLRTSVGFDHREYRDNLGDTSIGSNLVTAGVEYRPTDKLEISAKREQNLTEADPTYPDQTTFSIKYKLNSNAKLFVTQRLAASAITPIGDFSGNGFSAVGSRHETAFGIETKLPYIGAFTGRYQIENGVDGFDNFAVIGLQNRWKLSDKIALETGFERGFLLKGTSDSFNSATLGAAWTPAEGFRANARYELRDRNGLGQLFAFGAAGKLGDNWTTSARAQWAFGSFNGRRSSSSAMTAALAYRPLDSDKYALLFSYNHRESYQNGFTLGGIEQGETRDRLDRLSADGLYQVNDDLELYGRFALNFNGNGNNTTAYASALTYLMQVRAQQRLTDMLDFSAEGRWLAQPASNTFRRSFGAELGFWIVPDLRIGSGYNFVQVNRHNDFDFADGSNFKRGFYLTLTTKISNLFDLFGTSKTGLENHPGETKPDANEKIADNKPDKQDD